MTKKNLVFAVDKNSFNDESHYGVRNKVNSQLLFFTSLGFKCSLFEYEWIGGYPDIIVSSDTSVLYFRTIEPSLKLILKLRSLKKIAANMRIIMEIPTYPVDYYGLHVTSIKKVINIEIGKRLLKCCIDRVVVIACQSELNSYCGIPVIHATNGISVNKESIKDINMHPGEVHLIAVSGCFPWHGYERLIRGIYNYNKWKLSTKVFFHIVGDGECLELYKREATEKELINRSVFFYGSRTGTDLEEIYSNADIVISGLAAYKQHLSISASLKSREGLSRGLPFVSSIPTDISNEEIDKYILLIPDDDSDIEVRDIVDFYYRVFNGDYLSIKNNIREVANKYYSWDSAFANVIEYLNS